METLQNNAASTTTAATGTTATTQEQTFTQTDVDRMIQQRLERERKKYPSEEEMTAYNAWKANNQTEKQHEIQREKDLATAQSKLAAAQGEVEQLKREKYVLAKGLTGEEAEFVIFKAAKMVDDKTTFEQAVDKVTEKRKKVTFDWTAQAGGVGKSENVNAAMNQLIRGAFK